MMTNLFSMFDPSTSIVSFNWMTLIFLMIFMPLKKWKIEMPTTKILNKIIKVLSKEIKFSLKKSEKGSILMIMVLFLIISMMNIIALYPYTFSATSHVTITLPLSLAFWMTIMTFGWMNNTKFMLSHLLPQGTPNLLMPFMVLIELISNLIRPITLCVRLTANLVAGHLLMSLLGNALLSTSIFTSTFLLSIPFILTILESSVSVIQAYVFMTLITLYITETK